MNNYLKALLIVVILGAVSINTLRSTKASDQLPKELIRDCSKCENDPNYLDYLRQAEEGSISATYQAAAALINCYIQNGCYGASTGYSYEELMNMYNQNIETVRELGDEQPNIKLPDSAPENENYEDNNNYEESGNGTVKSAK